MRRLIALVSVALLVLAAGQAVSGQSAPTENECRPHIEKALKELTEPVVEATPSQDENVAAPNSGEDDTGGDGGEVLDADVEATSDDGESEESSVEMMQSDAAADETTEAAQEEAAETEASDEASQEVGGEVDSVEVSGDAAEGESVESVEEAAEGESVEAAEEGADGGSVESAEDAADGESVEAGEDAAEGESTEADEGDALSRGRREATEDAEELEDTETKDQAEGADSTEGASQEGDSNEGEDQGESQETAGDEADLEQADEPEGETQESEEASGEKSEGSEDAASVESVEQTESVESTDAAEDDTTSGEAGDEEQPGEGDADSVEVPEGENASDDASTEAGEADGEASSEETAGEASSETGDAVDEEASAEAAPEGDASVEEAEGGASIEAAEGDASSEAAEEVAEGEASSEAAEEATEEASSGSVEEAAEGDASSEAAEGDASSETAEGDASSEAAEGDASSEAAEGEASSEAAEGASSEAVEEAVEEAEAPAEEGENAEGSEETEGEATAETAEGEADTAEEAGESVEEPEAASEEAGEEAAEPAAPVDEEEAEPTPEEELSFDVDIPDNLRPRDHIAQILRLDEDSVEDELLQVKTAESTLKELKRFYDSAIKPLEILYKYRDLSNRHFGDPEIFSKPLVLFMGPWSGGKSSIINYLLDNEYKRSSLRTGAEPSPAYFNILMWGEREEVLDGTQLAADWTFSGLQKFGQGLLDRLRGLRLNNRLLEKVNIVEIPGILEIRKQVERLFPFNDACQWFIDRADIIFLVYDPAKLDVGPETEAILDQLKGREYQTRIILNKADQVRPEELMRVQGTLIWNISPLMSSTQPPVMYSTSLWSMPYEIGAPLRLLRAQERAFLRDMRDAIDHRVENKIASARRFAVRVRNHAKMVDCYLTTYYNHKSFFGNRKKVADDIIEKPQDYHIYEGLSTLTNISRYDLPDPDTYRDFFRVNPLYEFELLASTCTYFKGCPINRLDVTIAYELPELVGKYKKAAEAAAAKAEPKS